MFQTFHLPAGDPAEAYTNTASSQMGTALIKKVQCMGALMMFLIAKIHTFCYVVCKIALQRFNKAAWQFLDAPIIFLFSVEAYKQNI